MSYENVEIETRGKVGIIRLNRPQALNALNAALIADLSHAVDAFEASSAIGCIVITGSEKAFAAGADILAADNAKFGQPEIKLGVIPGIGGTQRLTRAVGKAKAMDLCLTGRMMDAQEAERAGLVARIVPLANLLEEAVKTAETIASMSLPAVMLAKESINRAFEVSLAEGVRFERRVFHSLFATEDQKEGMAAFIEKRAPKFRNR